MAGSPAVESVCFSLVSQEMFMEDGEAHMDIMSLISIPVFAS